MEFIDVLRVLFLIGMVYGAWSSYKALPKPIMIDGRRAYRQPDGSYRTWWGGRIKVPDGFVPPPDSPADGKEKK